ncbi:MAG TPA: hypothetical protein VF521_01080 [Pyrinomonadaceae bacterium]|jgi:hypothetical protein
MESSFEGIPLGQYAGMSDDQLAREIREAARSLNAKLYVASQRGLEIKLEAGDEFRTSTVRGSEVGLAGAAAEATFPRARPSYRVSVRIFEERRPLGEKA